MAEDKKDLTLVVSEKQVHASQNPNYAMVSIPRVDKERDDEGKVTKEVKLPGFDTVAVNAANIVAEGTKRRVTFAADQNYDVSHPETGADGKKVYQHESKTGKDIFEAAPGFTQVKDNDLHLTMDADKVHTLKKYPQYAQVEVPDPEAAGGKANVRVLAKNVTPLPASDPTKPPQVDVNFGDRDAKVDVSIRGKDGKFEHPQMTAAQFADKYVPLMAEQHSAEASTKRAASMEAPVPAQSEAAAPAIADEEMAIE